MKTRSDPEERELTLARAKIGELMMRLELAESGGSTSDERRREPEHPAALPARDGRRRSSGSPGRQSRSPELGGMPADDVIAVVMRLIAEFITHYNAEWLIERLGPSDAGGRSGRGTGLMMPTLENAIAQWRQNQRSSRGAYRDIPPSCPGSRERYTESRI